MSSLPTSPLGQASYVLSEAMKNQDWRSLIAAQNFANKDTTPSRPGEKPYQARTLVFQDVVDPETKTHVPRLREVGYDTTPFPRVYDPGHPAADQSGMVQKSNVKGAKEMVDYQEAHLAQSGCVQMYRTTTRMIERLHNLMNTAV